MFSKFLIMSTLQHSAKATTVYSAESLPTPRAWSGLCLLVSKVTQIYAGPPLTVITYSLQRERNTHKEIQERKERKHYEDETICAGREGRPREINAYNR